MKEVKRITVRSLKIEREHAGGKAHQSNSTNKNYTKVFLPLGSAISSVTRNGVMLQPGEYTLTTEFNKTVVGFWMTTQVYSKTIANIEYTIPNKFHRNAILYQKQPGCYFRFCAGCV